MSLTAKLVGRGMKRTDHLAHQAQSACSTIRSKGTIETAQSGKERYEREKELHKGSAKRGSKAVVVKRGSDL